MGASNCEHSTVFSSVPIAIKWLRDRVQQNQSVRFQVTKITPQELQFSNARRKDKKFNDKMRYTKINLNSYLSCVGS